MRDFIHDSETYPNYYSIGFEPADSDEYWYFEISTRRDDRWALIDYVTRLSGRMAGYNNIGFDYPVLHYILMNPHATVGQIYDKAQQCIFGDRFSNMVWESDWVQPQLDLYKIHHFDNANRATSLKMLEFNMRLPEIADLPIKPGTVLTHEQMDQIAAYMRKDIKATKKFYHLSREKIEFREELTERYGKNFLNHNDTKIGKDYFIMELGEDVCFTRENGRREPRQTHRPVIDLRDVIFPYIKFEHPEFQRIHEWLLSQKIYETKGVFKGLSATVDGFKYDFGTGGIHGSVESCIVYSDDEYVIDDRDVASYYPNTAIKNRLYPEHLGEHFCRIYEDVYNQRRQHPKGSAPNAMLKLALNGVYGDSNSEYSPFYDPQYTMAITINGQLLLCILAEQLIKVPGLQMIQINTDGLTTRYPRRYASLVNEICQWWEQYSLLTLESVEYSMMAIKNVNSYLAVTTDGKIKRKKDYATLGAHTGKGADLDWHQPHSALVVPMAAEANLLYGVDIREFITSHADLYDFMQVVRVPKSNRLELGGKEIQGTTRYYVSTNGDYLFKVAPPAAPKYVWTLRNPETGKTKQFKSEKGVASNRDRGFTEIVSKTEQPPKDRNTAICKGWRVTEANDMPDSIDNLNYEYYIQEAKKLVDPLQRI